VNYDLQIIEFLKSLDDGGPLKQYEALKDSLNRRPTLIEMYRAGVNLAKLRSQYGDWWSFINDMGDLSRPEQNSLSRHKPFFKELETTKITKSYKMVLIESLMENDGFRHPPTVSKLSRLAFEVFRRRRKLLADLPESFRNIDEVNQAVWKKYWEKNPVNAWIGGNRDKSQKAWFTIQDNKFVPTFDAPEENGDTFDTMLMELVDYRILRYEENLHPSDGSSDTQGFNPGRTAEKISLPYFPNIQIACGHFKAGQADLPEYRNVPIRIKDRDTSRYFLAQASGNSMNGGDAPVKDGDYLVMEQVSYGDIRKLIGSTVGLERINQEGNAEYLLRMILEQGSGELKLHATNPGYNDIDISSDINVFARLVNIISPLNLRVGEVFMRAEIPELFGTEFNGSVWNTGHVALKDQKAHILLVTLNKQSAKKDQRYLDYFIDEKTFHWQSQNNTSPEGKRGQEIINHEKMGIKFHLFIRENKLNPDKKAAPFVYHGEVRYKSHEGSQPMSVVWEIMV
jgi:SOS-response transcriptional repressor LexA